VRAYDQAVVLPDATVAPELAVALASRKVGVVTGPVGATGGLPVTAVDGRRPCGLPPTSPLAGELAMACATHHWAGELLAGTGRVPVGQGAGAVLNATADGLRGISVWLDGRPDDTELTLYDLADDGLALGREVAQTHAVGTDRYGLTLFPFDPAPDSAGRRYAFRLACAACDGLDGVTVPAPTGDGGLIVGTELHDGRALAFTPVYDGLAGAPSATTTVRGGMPRVGEWRIETSGSAPALVVVTETRFPGWHARVDGKAVNLLPADGAFMGVVVPAGDHHVSLDYRPPVVSAVGRLITAATLGLVALVLVQAHRRRRRT
jgi:hypothetical protein